MRRTLRWFAIRCSSIAICRRRRHHNRSNSAKRLSDGIYVLRRDDTLIVKRVAVHPASKLVTISSDNTAYPTWSEVKPSSIDVVGRVVWTGRRVS